MGMTIDEHKEHLLDIMDSMPDDACGDWRDSLACAIDTMRKYQKIKEIVENNNENQDMLRFLLIFATLLFPTEQNGELKMTQNEENNLNMLIKEIGDIDNLLHDFFANMEEKK